MSKWICAFFLILTCANPTASRAYSQYAPPHPPAKRYKVVKTFEAVVSRYIKPRREDYKSKGAYLAAIKLNGQGKKTFFGTPPKADFTIAANQGVKPGSKLGRFKRGTIVRIKFDDGREIIGKVDDRCAAAEDLWKKRKTVQFDLFSEMSQKQANAWGKRKMTVEILQKV